MHKSERFV